VQSLGFKYDCASSPSEFNTAASEFFQSSPTVSSLVLEVFTNSDEESKALEMINNIATSSTKEDIRRSRIKSMIGTKNVKKLRKLLGRNY
jgi:2-succinyl-5-enolpyruvyl-6-hydroxy-3-cyclohexene-1-carboxylate synthase